MTWSGTFAAIAIAISNVAAMTSMYQARMARRKEQAEGRASDPIIEPSFLIRSEDWPDNWLRLSLLVRNREEAKIIIEQVDIIKPTSFRFFVSAEKATWHSTQKPIGTGQRSVLLHVEVNPHGTLSEGISGQHRFDTASVALDLFVPPNDRRQSRFTLAIRTGKPNRSSKGGRFFVDVDIPSSAWMKSKSPQKKNPQLAVSPPSTEKTAQGEPKDKT